MDKRVMSSSRKLVKPNKNHRQMDACRWILTEQEEEGSEQNYTNDTHQATKDFRTYACA